MGICCVGKYPEGKCLRLGCGGILLTVAYLTGQTLNKANNPMFRVEMQKEGDAG